MKLSNLTSGKNIVPGTQVVRVISAATPESRGAAVLYEIVSNQSQGKRVQCRLFSPWEECENVLVSKGHVVFQNKQYPLMLKIGVTEGLVLQDCDGKNRSMKPINGELVLNIGKKVTDKQIGAYANELICCWVVHGNDWQNRSGDYIHNPYGFTKRYQFNKYFFNVIDGAKKAQITLKDLINLGCVRSTHVGDWQGRHSTIIAALLGMPMVLHEFKEGGQDICRFGDQIISKDAKVWGPYCRWDEAVRHSDNLGLWKDLALQASSPFAFHVHATRTLFQGAQLDSHVLLEKIGGEKLRRILDVIVASDPERFYRLIDENGITHRLTKVENDSLVYGSYGNFHRHSITDNVIATFENLQRIQQDCRVEMPRMARVVLDTHFYLVVEALAAATKTVYALSGRDMHRYLTEGDSANMHKNRNERLFLLLRDFFNVTSIDFCVYPPLSINSGVQSQYQNTRFCDREAWLLQEV